VASPVTLLINTGTDFLAGAHAWRLWTKFGWHDMVARYRRSWIGPLWLILSAAIFIAALSLVYSTLFRMELSTYVPFVAVGVVIWGFISSVASESVNTFVESETYIRQVRANLFVYVLRVIWRNVLVFAHQFVVVLVVLALFATLELRMLPLAALGMFVLFLQALWITPLLGLIGTRFRDLQPIITNLLQVLFFITPVIWAPALLGSRRWIADMNPLTSLIAVVRGPLLGNMPTLANYAIVLAMTAAGFLLTMLMYGRFRSRVVYWL
jgi:homopolymeric O-antigen transport system permease protein